MNWYESADNIRFKFYKNLHGQLKIFEGYQIFRGGSPPVYFLIKFEAW